MVSTAGNVTTFGLLLRQTGNPTGNPAPTVRREGWDKDATRDGQEREACYSVPKRGPEGRKNVEADSSY